MISHIKNNKKLYLVAVIACCVGFFAHIAFQYIQSARKGNPDFRYRNDSAILFSITEQEMTAKKELNSLFQEYGIMDPDRTDIALQNMPKEKESLVAAFLPKGSVIENCRRSSGDIEIVYKLNGIYYHIVYTEDHIYKGISIPYENEEYYIVNRDNKEYECSIMD